MPNPKGNNPKDNNPKNNNPKDNNPKDNNPKGNNPKGNNPKGNNNNSKANRGFNMPTTRGTGAGSIDPGNIRLRSERKYRCAVKGCLAWTLHNSVYCLARKSFPFFLGNPDHTFGKEGVDSC
jgi:hypothetical protein